VPLYLTYALMLFCFSSVTAARVILSLYALQIGATPSAVGVLVATFFALPLLLSWPVGKWSDRAGARWLLLFGCLSGACAMLVPYFSRNLASLYVAGTLVGLGFSFYNVLLQNLIGVISRPEERAKNISNASLIGATSNFAGPIIAGFAVEHAGPAVACLSVVALALTAAMLLVVCGHVLPRGARHAARRPGPHKRGLDSQLVRILTTSSLVQVSGDLFQFYIPVYGHAIGLSASAIGGVLGTFAAASFAVRFVMSRLIARFGEERLLSCSFYIAGAGFCLIPFFKTGVTLGVISFVFGLGMGCGQPITTILIFSRSAEGRTGETLGLRQTVNNVMRVSSPALFGQIATVLGLPAVFWISALLMGGGGLLSRQSTPSSASSNDATPKR
jgi:MFS family permease